MSEGVITDEAMKEMADQLKEKYDEIMEAKEKYKNSNQELKKDLMTLYGIFRLVDNLIDNEIEIDMALKITVELGRSIASSMLDHHIFND